MSICLWDGEHIQSAGGPIMLNKIFKSWPAATHCQEPVNYIIDTPNHCVGDPNMASLSLLLQLQCGGECILAVTGYQILSNDEIDQPPPLVVINQVGGSASL